MQQQELFDFRRDILFERENQIARFYDVLSETEDTISYAEHIDPKKKFSICGMDYEEYVDVKKKYLKGLTYDQILNYLMKFKKEERLDKYKILLKFSNIPFDRGIEGMARAQDPDSANSQFFIMFQDGHFLNGNYTVFGKVLSGMDIVDKIKKGDPNKNGMIQKDPDFMNKVIILEN